MDKWVNSYQHRFRVQASVQQVTEFHSRAASMAAITPPPIIVKIHHAPDVLADGDRMGFTMWIGPLPIYWEAQIEAVSPAGFTDRQLRGPFDAWAHRHSFVAVNADTTEVVDKVELRLHQHPFWWLAGLAMRIGMPFLFAFRAWKTKRMLK
jgi:ligand-binding SRPBCC domain-containing protein